MNTRTSWMPIAMGAGLALALSAAAHAADEPKKDVRSEVVVISDGHGGMDGEHMKMRMGGPMHPPLAEMDTNKDGVVSKEEFLAFHAAMYDKMAAEHGGKLTVPPPGEHHVKIIVDGKELPPGEMPPGMEMHMREMGGMEGHMDGHMGGPGDHVIIMRHGGEGHGGHEGMDGHHGMGFEELDKNKDGKISFEEFAAPMREVFNELDKNHSGYLEKDELPKGHMEIHRKVRMEEHSEHHNDKK